MGLGPGTTNYVELMSLKLLLIFAKEKNVNSLHIFGDSLNVIKWV
jgi:ribonuclease HI